MPQRGKILVVLALEPILNPVGCDINELFDINIKRLKKLII